MANIEPAQVPVKGGTVAIRTARGGDAVGVIALNRHLTSWEFSLVELDETSGDVQELATEIEKAVSDPQHLRLVAIGGESIVGTLDFAAPGKRRIRHRGRFGIAIAAEWRGRGIGTALINAMISWARGHPHIEKIRLGVLAKNTRAITLYERLGFAEEARRAGEFVLGDGTYCDDVMMCMWVKPRGG